MKYDVTTPPAEEPVSLAEAKLHMRVDGSDEDSQITLLIKAARRWCEERCDRAFVHQSITLKLDAFPIYWPAFIDQPPPGYAHGGIPFSVGSPDLALMLPRPKAISVTAITYTDPSGNSTTLASDQYQLDKVSEPARLLPAYGTIWPATKAVPNAVSIEYSCGYGAAAAVDERAKMAVLFLAAHWYANREAVITGTISKELELTLRDVLGSLWHGYLS